MSSPRILFLPHSDVVLTFIRFLFDLLGLSSDSEGDEYSSCFISLLACCRIFFIFSLVCFRISPAVGNSSKKTSDLLTVTGGVEGLDFGAGFFLLAFFSCDIFSSKVFLAATSKRNSFGASFASSVSESEDSFLLDFCEYS